MAEHAGVSHTTVDRIWNAHELKPHLVHTFKLSRDSLPLRTSPTALGLSGLAHAKLLEWGYYGS